MGGLLSWQFTILANNNLDILKKKLDCLHLFKVLANVFIFHFSKTSPGKEIMDEAWEKAQKASHEAWDKAADISHREWEKAKSLASDNGQ